MPKKKILSDSTKKKRKHYYDPVDVNTGDDPEDNNANTITRASYGISTLVEIGTNKTIALDKEHDCIIKIESSITAQSLVTYAKNYDYMVLIEHHIDPWKRYKLLGQKAPESLIAQASSLKEKLQSAGIKYQPKGKKDRPDRPRKKNNTTSNNVLDNTIPNAENLEEDTSYSGQEKIKKSTEYTRNYNREYRNQNRYLDGKPTEEGAAKTNKMINKKIYGNHIQVNLLTNKYIVWDKETKTIKEVQKRKKTSASIVFIIEELLKEEFNPKDNYFADLPGAKNLRDKISEKGIKEYTNNNTVWNKKASQKRKEKKKNQTVNFSEEEIQQNVETQEPEENKVTLKRKREEDHTESFENPENLRRSKRLKTKSKNDENSNQESENGDPSKNYHEGLRIFPLMNSNNNSNNNSFNYYNNDNQDSMTNEEENIANENAKETSEEIPIDQYHKQTM